jgi:pimeloyl-ACP methyl ester carboxylesterase
MFFLLFPAPLSPAKRITFVLRFNLPFARIETTIIKTPGKPGASRGKNVSKDFQIAQLWIGGNLSYMEQLCAVSFRDAGHHIKMYTYGDVGNIPDGIEIADANEIMPLGNVIAHKRTGSPAPQADKWRYNMLAKCDRTIWADTDAYCVKRFTSPNGHFHGWESAKHINNGVVGLPQDSEALAGLIDFTSDEYAIPDWFDPGLKAEMMIMKEAGNPVHVGEQSWGVWGPQALTHFLHKTGEHKYAMPIEALFPVSFKKRRKMLKPNEDMSKLITDNTLSIHFWGRRMRMRIIEREGGEPHPDSLIGKLIKKHNIVPSDAPLPKKNPHKPKDEAKAKAEPKTSVPGTAIPYKGADKAIAERVAWNADLKKMGDEQGFYEELGEDHSALFVKSGKTLIVTFENLDHVFDHNEGRLPWGFDFVQSQGWSILGLMAHDWTWYRDGDVHKFFDRLKREKFFDQFDKVVFYGASMGAYAACAFSHACPGATVVAISPQATLDRDVAPWEKRYQKAWARDFNSKYGYAPDMVKRAKEVFILYDPLEDADAMHAALFRGKNITKLKCRFQGHRIASGLINMSLLKPVISDCVDGSLTRQSFYNMLRARRNYRRYLRELITRIDADRHPYLIALLAERVLSTGNGPVFRKRLKEATKILDKRGISPPQVGQKQ